MRGPWYLSSKPDGPSAPFSSHQPQSGLGFPTFENTSSSWSYIAQLWGSTSQGVSALPSLREHHLTTPAYMHTCTHTASSFDLASASLSYSPSLYFPLSPSFPCSPLPPQSLPGPPKSSLLQVSSPPPPCWTVRPSLNTSSSYEQWMGAWATTRKLASPP